MKWTALLSLLIYVHLDCWAEDEIINQKPYKFHATYSAERRRKLKEKENTMSMGGRILLTEKEQKVNDILMYFKRKELKAALRNPEKFPPTSYFFDAKRDIEASEVFSILKRFPKGAKLKVTPLGDTSSQFLYNMTFEDDLYLCQDDEREYLSFPEENLREETLKWKKRCGCELVKDIRRKMPEFDKSLMSKLTMVVEKPFEAYTAVTKINDANEMRKNLIKNMLHHPSISTKHYYKILQEMYEDNVMYVEFQFRTSEDNSDHFLDNFAYFKEALSSFCVDYPDFLGAKIILEIDTELNEERLEFLRSNLQIWKKDLKIIQSFNFSFLGMNEYTIDDVLSYKYGTELFNSFLLEISDGDLLSCDNLMGRNNLKFGVSIYHQLQFINIWKQQNFGWVVCPIFEHVLENFRTNPAAVLIANDFQVVVGSIAPGLFDYQGLSYDWYMFFMCIASWEADLKILKQLAINSIQFSSMSEHGKAKGLKLWNKQLNTFIQEFLEYYEDLELHEFTSDDNYFEFDHDHFIHEEF